MTKTTQKNIKIYLIFPKTEKIVCVTSIDGLEDTRVSANHREGTALTIIVSGLLATPPEYPAHSPVLVRRTLIVILVEKSTTYVNQIH